MRFAILVLSIPLLFTELRGQDAAYLAQFDAFQKASGTEAMQRSAMEAMMDVQEQDPDVDKEFLKRFRKEVLGRLGELNAEIAVLYYERFSLEELQEMTRFYETPLGRKLARENPGLVEGSTRIGATWGQRVATEVLEGMR